MAAILVVDDESGMRELAARQLLVAGHLTHAARTAEEALDVLALTSDIAVVVADLQMPGHGGAWLVEQIVQRFPAVAVVLATADAAVPGTLSLQSPVVRYLVKPISGDQLLAAVAQGIGWHEQQRRELPNPDGGADPFGPWLDRKLTRRDDDDNSSDD